MNLYPLGVVFVFITITEVSSDMYMSTNAACGICGPVADCPINATGFKCIDSHEEGSIIEGQESNLPKCVPSKYKVVADLTKGCCFWSPRLGCQFAGGKEDQDSKLWPRTCGGCRRKSMCPCGPKKIRENGAWQPRLAGICFAVSLLRLIPI